MVKYRYDAWGNCRVLNAGGVEITDSNNIGILNPFRYRSYYYDTETGFYFLKTRYYDPEIGRFMTIDDLAYLDLESINGLNLYAYCGSNPVMGYDPNGTFDWDWGVFWRVLGSTLAIAGGIALCFVPGAQAIGAGLIITGAGGMIGGTISFANGYGFNYGWDIGTIIGGAIGLVVAAPQLMGLTFKASFPFVTSMLTTTGELVLVGSTVSVAIPVGGAIAVAVGAGLGISLITTKQKYGGYKAVKHPGDHAPNHVHLQGTDGSDVRIGENGKPLDGEPSLNPQQKKALERLWKEICERLFPWG